MHATNAVIMRNLYIQIIINVKYIVEINEKSFLFITYIQSVTSLWHMHINIKNYGVWHIACVQKEDIV